VKVNATVNKTPEESIQQIYSVLLRTINMGYNKEEDLSNFLGLQKEDFILRELYFLKERGFLNFTSGSWIVTEQGMEFIKDNSRLKILENEDFEFIIDAISNQVKEKKTKLISTSKNQLAPEIDYLIKSSELLEGKHEEIADIYKNQNNSTAFLVDFDNSSIRFDKKEWQDYLLIEYVPIKAKEEEIEPFLEIRDLDKNYTIEKSLSKLLTERYPNVVEAFSTSDRQSIAKIQDKPELVRSFINPLPIPQQGFQQLTIWETQTQFIEALKTARKKILIESPWIKRATSRYIKSIESALKSGVKVYILYGISGNDNHHGDTMMNLERLASKYNNFFLIHLPSHFEQNGISMQGTHRKLVIKDDDFYILGSFNFLSFNKSEGQKVANEESLLVTVDVNEKWQRVIEEYRLNIVFKI